MRKGDLSGGHDRLPEGFSEFFACLTEWEKLGRTCQEVLNVSPRLVDASGRMVVGEDQLSPLCRLVHSSPLGRRRCRECYWRHSLTPEDPARIVHTCYAGLLYVWLPLQSGLAAVLGSFKAEGEEWQPPSSLLVELGLSPEEIAAAAAATPARRSEELSTGGRLLKSLVGSLGEALGGQIGILRQLERLGELAVKRADVLRPDTSTGLLNADGLHARLKEEVERAQKASLPLSLLLFEVEAVPDSPSTSSRPQWALKEAAQIVTSNTRRRGTASGGAGDAIGLLGEKRLGLVLPETEHHQAYELGNRLHAAIQQASEGKEEKPPRSFFGVSSLSPDIGPEELLKRAEDALTAAKQDIISPGHTPGHIFARPAKDNPRSDRRVVVSGIGLVTPYGMGKDLFWNGAIAGRSVIDRITLFDPAEMPSQIAGEIRNFDPLMFMDAKAAKRSGRSSQLAVAATDLAIRDSCLSLELEDKDRIGVVIGSAVGGLEFGEDQVATYMKNGPKKVSPFLSIVVFAGAVSSEVSLHFGVKGPTITVSTGCAAGSDAIGYAFRSIKEGKSDVVIAGGSDAPLRPVIFASFCSINALSTRNNDPQKASRPFDLKRDGFVMSEGAGILILEDLQHALRRGANIYGEIVGYAATGDAFHMTRPAPNGEEAARAMQLALQDAQLRPDEVEYINAHGSSTPLNDKTETMAIKSVFGDHAYRLAVNSTKSLIGHPIGASGAIELAACFLSIQRGMLHPTINYEFPDPECDLDYVPNSTRTKNTKVAMSNSFGFGGKNAVLVVKAFEG